MATPSPHLERTVASVKEWSRRTTIAPTTTVHGLRDHEATILPPPIDFDSGVHDWKSFTISSEIRRKPTSIALPIVDDSAEGSQSTGNILGKQIHITMPAASTTTTSSTPKKKTNVIDTILARKQLQRIMVPLGSGMVGGRVVGYRNKVLHARRQLTRLVDANVQEKQKCDRKAACCTVRKLISENNIGCKPIGRGRVFGNYFSKNRNKKSTNKIASTPAAVIDPFTETSDPDDEILLVKHNLILNLEKFLDERKDLVKRKLELRLEKDRLEVLRKSKSESDLRHQLTGYCEIYSTCIDQMKYVQNKCQQLPDGSRIDIVHLELEESVENCLVEEIATGTAKTSESCPAEWPTLPAFNDDSNNCRCCESLNSCRQSADNSVLARRLKLEEERLKKKSAECQIQSYDEYRRLRVLQQRTNEQQLSSLSEQQSPSENVQTNLEDRSEQKRHLI
uniref:Uncharacterized protein n=1 Tax=Ditylenchus dipsaci TaxID=166011 RepID=A0A915EFE7_9BILA